MDLDDDDKKLLIKLEDLLFANKIVMWILSIIALLLLFVILGFWFSFLYFLID